MTLAGGGDWVRNLDPPALVGLPDLLPGGEPQQVRGPPPPAVPAKDVKDRGVRRTAGHSSGPGARGHTLRLVLSTLTLALPEVAGPEVLAQVDPVELHWAGGLPHQPLLEGPNCSHHGRFVLLVRLSVQHLPDVVLDVQAGDLLHEPGHLLLRQTDLNVVSSSWSFYGHPARVKITSHLLQELGLLQLPSAGLLLDLLPELQRHGGLVVGDGSGQGVAELHAVPPVQILVLTGGRDGGGD